MGLEQHYAALVDDCCGGDASVAALARLGETSLLAALELLGAPKVRARKFWKRLDPAATSPPPPLLRPPSPRALPLASPGASRRLHAVPSPGAPGYPPAAGRLPPGALPLGGGAVVGTAAFIPSPRQPSPGGPTFCAAAAAAASPAASWAASSSSVKADAGDELRRLLAECGLVEHYPVLLHATRGATSAVAVAAALVGLGRGGVADRRLDVNGLGIEGTPAHGEATTHLLVDLPALELAVGEKGVDECVALGLPRIKARKLWKQVQSR